MVQQKRAKYVNEKIEMKYIFYGNQLQNGKNLFILLLLKEEL